MMEEEDFARINICCDRKKSSFQVFNANALLLRLTLTYCTENR